MLLSCGQCLERSPQRAQTALRGTQAQQPSSLRVTAGLAPTQLGEVHSAAEQPGRPRASLWLPGKTCREGPQRHPGGGGFTLSPTQLGRQELQGVGPTLCPFHPRSTLRKPGKRK